MSTSAETPASTNWRDDRGRFTRNNPGGPGNPFARQVARLRQVLLDCVTPEDMAVIAHKLVELAKEGDVHAIKLLFSYTLGKPPTAEPPDQLDFQEWQLFRQTASLAEELPGLITTPDPSLPLQLVRAARPAVARDMSRELAETLRAGEEQERKRQELRDRRQQEAERAGAAPTQGQKPKAASAENRNGRAIAPERLEDPATRRSLEELAAQDNEALRALGSAGPESPSVAQVPPSPNGCNRSEPPEEAGAPAANGDRPKSDGFSRFWPLGDRG
jgi:hypothetical protein